MRESVLFVQRAFRDRGVRGNYTPAENMHLTLAFIGEYPDPDRVLELLAPAPMTPVQLAIEGVGAFGDLWWLGIRPCPALNDYVRRLRRALADGGVPFDRKRFSPHITLLRRAVPGPRGIPEIAVPAAEMIATCATLMRSDRGKGGVRYTPLGSVPY